MNEDFEPIVFKKANQFVSLKFADVKLPNLINFFGGASRFDLFLKAYKTSDTKGFFPYDWFDDPQEPKNTQLPP